MDRPQRLGRKAEQDVARTHGGRVTPGSGSGRSVKNDVRNAEWSMEVKSTQQKGYRLEYETLVAAERHALGDGRKMAFVIAFIKGWGDRKTERYVVMSEDDHLEREQYIRQLKEDVWAYNDLRNS